jgi:hypothetical protein
MSAPSIPYITLRDGEHDVTERALTLRRFGGSASLGIPATARIGYTDETPDDRDHHGVLYDRVTQNLDAAGWPTGKPDWAHVHPARQRECISEMLCHYCKGDPSQTKAGFLFLDVATETDQAKTRWPEGFVTYQPPLCLPHAKKAMDLCKYGHRQGGFTALRVRQPRLHGVLGTPYQISAGRPKPTRDLTGKVTCTIPFTHPDRRFFLGSQYAVAMHDVTVIDLDQELAAAHLT